MNLVKKNSEKYRYSIILLRQLVITDFKLRYQGSVLGYIWSLLRPLALFGILYVVFAKFLKVGTAVPNYPVYLLLGIVFWTYFTEVTANAVSSIVSRGDIIRKINFPKYVIVLSVSISAFINLSINFMIIFLLMFITGVDFHMAGLFTVFVLLELFVLTLALAFLLSSLFVRYRDVSYIWEVILQALFYATPILYPLSFVPPKIAKVLMLNPMAQIIQDARYILITHETATIDNVYGGHMVRIIPLAIIAVFLIISVIVFKRSSKYFAEKV